MDQYTFQKLNMVRLLLDLDGVLVKDKALNPFPDAVEFLRFLSDTGLPFKVVSNNSTRPPEEILQELKIKGVNLSKERLVTPLSVLPNYLREKGLFHIFVIGTPSLKSYLEREGFHAIENHNVQAVVIGQDRSLDFRKIKVATSAIFLSDAEIVPVNLSRIVKDDDGLYFPGAGSITQMLLHACNYNREVPNLGKPSKEFINYALRDMPEGETFLVSDDIYTDLIGAKDLGINTVFMTTGKYKREELLKTDFRPDFVFESLKDFGSFLKTFLR
ncbi:HAD-IIA family hydrolase [Hydrogenobacter thermophilus]|uniref:HAD-IIA family hydrolase n=1 Tax=Hydrogenobacter thermophilus TaxID=940 RepID=UPI0030FA8FD0